MALSLAILAGCATWTFEPTRTQKFVDESGRFVIVDYGMDQEPRETYFALSNGVRLPFKSKLKVRVEMPNGTRFVAYQHMSSAGNLYITDNEDWEYFERGTSCLIAEQDKDRKGFIPRYQGTLCASVRNPLNEKKQSIRNTSTPQDFGHGSTELRTNENKK